MAAAGKLAPPAFLQTRRADVVVLGRGVMATQIATQVRRSGLTCRRYRSVRKAFPLPRGLSAVIMTPDIRGASIFDASQACSHHSAATFFVRTMKNSTVESSLDVDGIFLWPADRRAVLSAVKRIAEHTKSDSEVNHADIAQEEIARNRASIVAPRGMWIRVRDGLAVIRGAVRSADELSKLKQAILSVSGIRTVVRGKSESPTTLH